VHVGSLLRGSRRRVWTRHSHCMFFSCYNWVYWYKTEVRRSITSCWYGRLRELNSTKLVSMCPIEQSIFQFVQFSLGSLFSLNLTQQSWMTAIFPRLYASCSESSLSFFSRHFCHRFASTYCILLTLKSFRAGFQT